MQDLYSYLHSVSISISHTLVITILVYLMWILFILGDCIFLFACIFIYVNDMLCIRFYSSLHLFLSTACFTDADKMLGSFLSLMAAWYSWMDINSKLFKVLSKELLKTEESQFIPLCLSKESSELKVQALHFFETIWLIISKEAM